MTEQGEKNQARFKDVLLIYFKQVIKYKWLAFFGLFFSTIAISANAITPIVLGQIFNNLEEVSEIRSWNLIIYPFSLLFILKFIQVIFGRISHHFEINFVSKVLHSLEVIAFNELLKKSYSFFTDNFSGSLAKKISRFVRSFETISDELIFRFWPIIIILVIAIFNLTISHTSLGIILCIWSIAYFALSIKLAQKILVLDLETNKMESRLGGILVDMVTNIMNIKLFANEKNAYQEYSHASQNRIVALGRAWQGRDNAWVVQQLFVLILEILLIGFSIHLWVIDTFSLGDIVRVQAFIALIIGNIYGVARSIKRSAEAYADGKEMVDIMKNTTEIIDDPQASILDVTIGEVEFHRVTFGFSSDKVLRKFNLKIAPQEKIAFVGPSGAGKSTIIKLLLRYFDVDAGSIKIDGQDIKKVTQHSLHRAIAIVPQEPILFHRSLMENIRYSRPSATDDEVIEASKKAYCHDFITKLPKGYNALVGERGIKLSGGERQRVALARAILMNAPILIMDEATSALDSESEMLIQRALDEVMRNKTVITIAHRLSTVMKMDRIIVIDNGKIIEQGSHNELLKNRGSYKKLWNIQVDSFKD